MSLGHKQLEENPWDTFETIFTISSLHEGTVVGVNDKGANVQLQYGIEGFAPKRHLVKENGGKIKDGEVLSFEVIEFNKDNKSIVLSHTNTWKLEDKIKHEEAPKEKSKSPKANTNKPAEKSTLGELDAFSDLKAMFDSANDKDAKDAKAVEPKEVKTATEGSDLKSLSGVGPAMEKRIIALGVNSLEQLKALTEDKIAELVSQDSKISAEQWQTWMTEAQSSNA